MKYIRNIWTGDMERKKEIMILLQFHMSRISMESNKKIMAVILLKYAT